jgi:hypothetical protein
VNPIGPLLFDPDFGGVVVYNGETTEQAFARVEQLERRRRIRQCELERDRILDALGWWEDAPARPEMLEEIPALTVAA